MRQFERNSGRDRKSSGRFGRDNDRPSFSRDDRGSSRFGSRDRRDRDDRRPSFRSEGRPDRGERRSGPLEMHSAVCAKCGKDCQVPFRPTSSKPVYCSDCFRKNDGSSYSRSGPSSGNSEELAKINKKLDKIIEALDIE